MSIRQQILKDCVEAQKNRGHINSTTKTQLDTFIGTISDDKFLEIEYTDFDQTNSVNSVFDDTLRTITYSGAGTDSLLTDTISLSDVDIKAIQIRGTDQNEVVQISKDGTNYFTVTGYEANVYISSSDTFKIKIQVNGTNTIKGLYIIYQTND